MATKIAFLFVFVPEYQQINLVIQADHCNVLNEPIDYHS